MSNVLSRIGLGRPGGSGLRIAVVTLAVLVAFLGVTAAGYVYINRVAAGIARVPVMFGKAHPDAPSQTPTAPR